MGAIIVPNVEVCVIICDELQNPAGGIGDLVDSTIQLVGGMTILDTGSKDGTKEKLGELSEQYLNLRVIAYDKRLRNRYLFRNPGFDSLSALKEYDGVREALRTESPLRFSYAAARNYLNSLAQLPYILVLDGDERLTPGDFRSLKRIMTDHPDEDVFEFHFRNVYIDEDDEVITNWELHTRLCRNNGYFFWRDNWPVEGEQLQDLKWGVNSIRNLRGFDTEIEIKHFKATKNAANRFRNEWYLSDMIGNPSDLPSFAEAHKFNPKRDLYR